MSLFRSIATIGGWTMGSRVLGFVRDILIAGSLGAGLVADAFFVAFKFPNFFRRLFAEGAFNAAFVPLFGEQLEKDGARAARVFAADTAALMVATLLTFTLLAIIAMPLLMYAIAPGFVDQSEKFDLTLVLCADVPLLDRSHLDKLYSEFSSGDYDCAVATFCTERPEGYGRIIRKGSEITIVEENEASPEEKKIKEVITFNKL